MEHRLVLAVVAEECHFFAEIHILQIVGDEAAVATLNALAKFGYDLWRTLAHLTTPRFDASINSTSISTSRQSAISSRMRSTACVVLSLEDSRRWNAWFIF